VVARACRHAAAVCRDDTLWEQLSEQHHCCVPLEMRLHWYSLLHLECHSMRTSSYVLLCASTMLICHVNKSCHSIRTACCILSVCNLNLQSQFQSPISNLSGLFSTERGKRDLDHRLRFEKEERTLHMQKGASLFTLKDICN